MEFIKSLRNYKSEIYKKRIREQCEEIIKLNKSIDSLNVQVEYLRKENNRLRMKLQNVEDFICKYDEKGYKV